jgi:hypothetical protein
VGHQDALAKDGASIALDVEKVSGVFEHPVAIIEQHRSCVESEASHVHWYRSLSIDEGFIQRIGRNLDSAHNAVSWID